MKQFAREIAVAALGIVLASAIIGGVRYVACRIHTPSLPERDREKA